MSVFGEGSQQGVVHFCRETLGRIRRAGASGKVTVRADSGFWSYEMFNMLDRVGVGWSITTPLYNNVREAIAGIDENT